MRLLALDISQRGCGIAMGDGSCPPHSAVAAFTGASHGAVGAQFRRWLIEQCVNYRPDAIFAEAPLKASAHKGSQASVELLTGLFFTARVVAAERDVRFVSVAIATWRKSFLGKGYPTDPKVASMEMCDLLEWQYGGSDDRAESMGIWAHGHLTEGNTQGIHKMLSVGSFRRMAG